MAQEFDTTGRSSEMPDFESQLRRFQPAPAENAEKIFYQAGWNAAELAAKNGRSQAARPLGFFTNSFTRGMIVGMAAALLVALVLPSTIRLWSSGVEVANSVESKDANNNSPSSAESPAAIDKARDGNAVKDAVRNPAEEPISQAVNSEAIAQLLPWNWKPAERTSKQSLPGASEESILSRAFDRAWLGLVSTDAAPLNNGSLSAGVPAFSREPQLRTSPLDIQRVLDFD